MSTQGSLKRYYLIIEKIRTNQHPSFRAIKEYLFDKGFEESDRTIQRDIEQIRMEFGMEITYDRQKNGYYIDWESSLNPDAFLRFLELVNTATLLIESFKDSKETLNFISFESHGQLRGIENLKQLLFAVKGYKKISFTHENYDTGKMKSYAINPYLLKEYQNRWYIVGMVEGMTETRTFGIDRIFDLKVENETFIPDPKINALELFENTIGLTYSNNKLQEIILSFTTHQGKYIKSLPLHRSQVVIVDNKNELRISLRIIPNLEFRQKILMLGRTVTVIEPQWLADEVKKSLSATLKNYK